MLFNSAGFLVFFALVSSLYYACPYRLRWALLLGASAYFYMAFIPYYILILAFTILLDYVAGLAISRAQGGLRRLYLIISLVSNIGVLAFFKYFNFLSANLGQAAQLLHVPCPLPHWNILLPLGLSFHTFQSMSYTIEVYRGRQAPERHLGIFALYVMFYPQLVAGPIERPQNLLVQLRGKYDFDYDAVTNGLKLMAWGFFKKIVIADQLAPLVDQVYNHPTQYGGAPLLLATLAFSYQIYCDFSGYSDIALGCAQVMGIRLMKNFNRPYASSSIAEFWRRWHISLSTWFKDYLYTPLGGNRVSRARWAFNITLVFVLSGLWHGANWTFVIWGALHGAFMLLWYGASRVARSLLPWESLRSRPLIRGLKILGTFSIVTFAWIFFRANSPTDAVWVISHLASGWRTGFGETIRLLAGLYPRYTLDAAIIVLSLIILEGVQFLQSKGSVRERLSRWPLWLRWPLYYAGILWIIIFGNFGSQNFIYFQF
jgi:alginate O-acetyltransferase complex protein AlgI